MLIFLLPKNPPPPPSRSYIPPFSLLLLFLFASSSSFSPFFTYYPFFTFLFAFSSFFSFYSFLLPSFLLHFLLLLSSSFAFLPSFSFSSVPSFILSTFLSLPPFNSNPPRPPSLFLSLRLSHGVVLSLLCLLRPSLPLSSPSLLYLGGFSFPFFASSSRCLLFS